MIFNVHLRVRNIVHWSLLAHGVILFSWKHFCVIFNGFISESRSCNYLYAMRNVQVTDHRQWNSPGIGVKCSNIKHAIHEKVMAGLIAALAYSILHY